MKQRNIIALLVLALLLTSLLVGCSSTKGSQISIPEGNLPDPYIFENEKRVISAAISNDRERIVAADDDNNVSVWDIESKEVVKKWQAGGNFLMAISPDDTHITLCTLREKIQVWNIESESLVFEVPYKCRNTIQYSPDGKMIVSGSLSDVIKAWDRTSGEELFSIPQTTVGTDINHDGSMMAYGDTTKKIHIWDMEAGEDILTFTGKEKFLKIILSPDGKTLATHNNDMITFYSVESGEVLFEISRETEEHSIYDIKYDASGNYLFVVFNIDKVEVWDLEKRELYSSFISELPVKIQYVDMSQDGGALLVAGFTQTGFVYLWEFDK